MLPLVLSIDEAETVVLAPDSSPPTLFSAPVVVALSAPPALTLPAWLSMLCALSVAFVAAFNCP